MINMCDALCMDCSHQGSIGIASSIPGQFQARKVKRSAVVKGAKVSEEGKHKGGLGRVASCVFLFFLFLFVCFFFALPSLSRRLLLPSILLTEFLEQASVIKAKRK